MFLNNTIRRKFIFLVYHKNLEINICGGKKKKCLDHFCDWLHVLSPIIEEG